MKKRAGSWFGEKIKSDGYIFDSKKEEAFYRRFKKNNSNPFDVHKSFSLHPIIELCDGDLRICEIHYSPDFAIYNQEGQIAHVIDVKNSFTGFAIDAVASLRFKLFALTYGLPVEVIVPRTNDFKVKIMGTTKKFNPLIKDNFNYNIKDLINEGIGGKALCK